MHVSAGWMDAILRPFQQYVSPDRQLADDNERLCAMEPCLWLRRFCLEQGSNPGPLDQ